MVILNQEINCIENCLIDNLVLIVKWCHHSKYRISKLAYDFLTDFKFLESEIDFVGFMQFKGVNLVAEGSSLYHLENLGYEQYFKNDFGKYNLLVFQLMNVYYKFLLKEVEKIDGEVEIRILNLLKYYIENEKKEYDF